MAPLPCPAAALQARYEAIWQGPMADVPIVNPALRVQALGFRPWGEHWLGVLVTPWFMNLVLMPRIAERWPTLAERESRHCVFPAGVFEFIASHDEVLGELHCCSLFSPMGEFADAATAAATAEAALQSLFERDEEPAPPAPAPPRPPTATALSKRDFLFGSRAASRSARGDGGG